MRCARCGNENSEKNRFCGMCGGSLLTATAPVGSGPAAGSAARSTTNPAPAASTPVAPNPAPLRPAPAARSSNPASDEAPVISGPSFLGLNGPALSESGLNESAAAPRRGNLSIDPNSAPGAGSLDYLLHDNDEEETKGGGAGKYVFILLALALAVGLGYLRWKNHGFAGFGLETRKPVTVGSDAPDASPSAMQPANNGGGTAASSSSAPAMTAPAPAPPATSQAGGAAAGASSTAGSTTGAPPSLPPAAPVAAPPGGTANAPTSGAPASATPTSSTPASDAPAGTTAAQPAPAAKRPGPVPTDSSPAANPTSNRAGDATPSKPSAALKPARAFDSVSEAQKYIYGRGVGQDCERGMRLLKPAADQANPRAMIEMGALYSAGLCTPRDLPTAYRWFALALRKDPDNQSVQTDLQKLWGEMTQPERQLAIKLSQ